MTSQPITALVLSTEAILRLALERRLPIKASTVQQAIGGDAGSIRRDLRRLRDEGLMSIATEGQDGTTYVLTEEGVEVVAALDRAANPDGAVTGMPVWPLDRIQFNPDNPRKSVSRIFIDGLADTIVEAGGLLQAIILYPPDANGARMLHAGEQRVRACQQLAEEGRLPASLAEGLPYTEREATRAEALFIGLVENSQREGLSPWEDAKALKAYADETGLSARAIAYKLGRAREGAETGVRDVQDKIRIATKAEQGAIDKYLAGGKWEDLRDSIREAKPLSAPTRLAMFELKRKFNEQPVTGDLPHGALWVLRSSDEQAISFRELVHAQLIDPQVVPIGGSLRSVVRNTDQGLRWWEKFTAGKSSEELLSIEKSLRHEAFNAEQHGALIDDEGFITPWLNARRTTFAVTGEAVTTPAQIELEEAIAAATPVEEVDPDLVVAVLEIAYRAHAHPGKASPLGPTTRVTRPINPMANREEHPVAVGLVAGGYALFDTSHPWQVVLLRPGVELARRFAEAPEELPDAIRTALRDAGIAEEDIDDMEREGECQTAWLNEKPDAPPPEISDALTLVLFEVYDSWKRQPGNEYYGDQPRHYGAPIQAGQGEEEIKTLQDAGLLGRFSCWRKDGLLRIRPQFAGDTEKLLRRLCADLDKAGERSKALHDLRSKVIGQAEAEHDRRARQYATAWLNGPFEPTPEGKAAMEADEAEAKKQSQVASVRAAKAAEIEARVAELEEQGPDLAWDDLRDRVQAILAERGQQGPFLAPPNGWNFATLGAARSGSVVDGQSVAARMARLAIAALTGCWPKSDLDDDHEAKDWVEYESWITGELIGRHGVPPMRAPAFADKVRARLQADDPDDLDFTRAGAREAAAFWAEDHLEDGNLIEPEQSETEEEQADAAVA
jgi:ParB/RepB/Spo0J family partition protein